MGLFAFESGRKWKFGNISNYDKGQYSYNNCKENY